MERKLNILQLVPRFPFPADDGGKIGIANIFKQFSKHGCNVTLVSLNHEKISKHSFEEACQYGKIEIIEHSATNSIYNIVKSFLKNEPLYFSKHQGKKVFRKINDILRNEEFDVVHADHSCMAPLGLLVKHKLKIPVGLRLHNIEWQIWEKYRSKFFKTDLRYLYLTQQYRKVYEFEKILYEQSDVCFAITENDYIKSKAMAPNANVIIAGPGINQEEWIPIEGVARESQEIVIATTFRWIHNVEAVLWLIQKVLPIVKAKIPNVKLTIIGKDIPHKISRFDGNNINVVGYVEDVRQWLSRANVYVAPLFVGGGVRIKILEALAMGLPVVATSISAEGIHVEKDNGLLIADNESDFAEAIIKLLSDFDKARALGEKARDFVVKHYSWRKSVATMIEAYKSLIYKYERSKTLQNNTASD